MQFATTHIEIFLKLHYFILFSAHSTTPRSPSVIPNDQLIRPQERKVAYVQPQIQSSQHSKPPTSKQKKVDPIKALSSMASQPMINTTQSSSLSISHARPSAAPLTVSKILHFLPKFEKKTPILAEI